MGLLAFVDRSGNGAYSFARSGDRIHLLVTTEQVSSVASPEGGSDCVLRTSDGREFPIRESMDEIQSAIQASGLL